MKLLRIKSWLWLVCTVSAIAIQSAALAQSATVCPVRDYGAVGDGQSLDTKAINRAIEHCYSVGGGTVAVTAGVYRSGTIYLRDNITLDLARGATILASDNLSDYPPMAHASEWRNTSLLIAENVKNIAITGEGTIDGNGRAFVSPIQTKWQPSFDVLRTRQGQAWADRMALSNQGPLTMKLRPGVLFVALHVDGLTIKNIHIVDSPNWTIKIGCSQHIRVTDLDVRNNLLIPNNDALDISTSSDAIVSGGHLEAGDDAIVIGGPCLDGWCAAPASNISVHDVTLISRSAAIRVGPALQGVHDVKVSHVKIIDSNRGILLHTRTNEKVENISFDHIEIATHLIDGPWWGAGEPITIGVALSDYVSWPKVTTMGNVGNIHFSDITTTSDSPIVIYGMEPGHIHDISFERLSVTIKADALNAILGGNLDLQPTSPDNFGVQKHDLPAILLHNAGNVQFDRLKIRWQGAFPPGYTGAIGEEGENSLTLHHFDGQASAPGIPLISNN